MANVWLAGDVKTVYTCWSGQRGGRGEKEGTSGKERGGGGKKSFLVLKISPLFLLFSLSLSL